MTNLNAALRLPSLHGEGSGADEEKERDDVSAGPRVYSIRGSAYPHEGGVRIDRTTKWGNPFLIGRDGTRKEVIEKYEAWLNVNSELREASKRELRGKNLLCWCPLACHGDVLLRIANEPLPRDTTGRGT